MKQKYFLVYFSTQLLIFKTVLNCMFCTPRSCKAIIVCPVIFGIDCMERLRIVPGRVHEASREVLILLRAGRAAEGPQGQDARHERRGGGGCDDGDGERVRFSHRGSGLVFVYLHLYPHFFKINKPDNTRHGHGHGHRRHPSQTCARTTRKFVL